MLFNYSCLHFSPHPSTPPHPSQTLHPPKFLIIDLIDITKFLRKMYFSTNISPYTFNRVFCIFIEKSEFIRLSHHITATSAPTCTLLSFFYSVLSAACLGWTLCYIVHPNPSSNKGLTSQLLGMLFAENSSPSVPCRGCLSGRESS